jgi:ABC-2 type transport system ATP-binding protein
MGVLTALRAASRLSMRKARTGRTARGSGYREKEGDVIGHDAASRVTAMVSDTAPASGPAAIQVEGFAKAYGTVQAVKGISFGVAQGEIFGFLGPNGAGKSTTIRAMLDLIRPTAGTIRLLGLDAQRDALAIHRRTGYVPGDVRLPRGITGRQLLDRYSRMQGLQPVLLDELVKRFDVELDRPLQGYSKGMRQKIALVQAFMCDPELAILDEPTSGLDPISQRAFTTFLLDEARSGRTVFMSSHIMADVEKTCARVGVIRAGELVAVERVETLRQRAGQTVTVEFGPNDRPEGLDAMRGIPGVVDLDVPDNHETSAGSGLGAVTFTVRGSVGPLIKTLARYDVVRLSAEEAPLEQVFLQFYETPAPETGVAPAQSDGQRR